MPAGISDSYRELTYPQAEEFARTHAGWLDPEIPERQFQRVVNGELDAFRSGKPVRPFDALRKCLETLPEMKSPSLLDVGAASGYYSEVLKIIGFPCDYAALDFSPEFKRAAATHFPDVDFSLGRAEAVPFKDGSFDIVLHSGCLLHCLDYSEAIREAARVAKRYVIFHRTPLSDANDRTTYFTKLAYDCPCLEIWFNEAELLELFHDAGLRLHGFASVGPQMKSYVLEKNG